MSKLIESLFNKTASEAVELLSQKYAAVQKEKVASEKIAIDKDTRNALIGAAVGAGGGGLATLGLNYLKGKDLKASDALYGAMAGAIPVGALGYYGGGSIEDMLSSSPATATAKAPAATPPATPPTTTPPNPGASAGGSAGGSVNNTSNPPKATVAPALKVAPGPATSLLGLLDPEYLGSRITLDQANAIEGGALNAAEALVARRLLVNPALNAINPHGVHSSRTQKATKALTMASLIAAYTAWGANTGYHMNDPKKQP